MNINTVHIAGRVTKKPELRALPSGSKVCSFSIATNYIYKDQSGNKKEEVEFHNITSFGKTAETIAQYVVQGQVLYVEGRIKTDSWEKDGIKHYKTNIIANNFQFGAKPKGNEVREETESENENTEVDEDNIADEDIPF
jgi:single-strand DNA-binding protein